MVNEFQANVTFGSKSRTFKSINRLQLFHNILKFCELSRDDVEMYDVTSGAKRLIQGPNDLADKMTIQVRKKLPSVVKLGVSTSNGLRSQALENDEMLKVPDKDLLIKKLIENNTLTGLERKFLINIAGTFYKDGFSSLKRGREDSPQTANKKVQVAVDHLKQVNSTQTQTEDFAPHIPSSSNPPTEDLSSYAKRLAHEPKKDLAKVNKIMNETYDMRRNFIYMKRPTVALVKEKYPLLFSVTEVRNELNRIFYPDKDVEFLANVEKYADAILSLVDDDNSFLKTIKAKMNSTNTPIQKKYAKEVGALLILSNLLNEKRLYLNTEDESWPEDNYPCIHAPCKVGKLFFDVQMYRIVVEGLTLCEASTFQEAVLCLMACYFIFNISYPAGAFNTFVVMEKIFLEANDTDGNEIDEQTKQIIKLIQLKTATKF